MCTCVKWYVSPGGVAYILAGFEDGSVVLWDCRNKDSELAALKLFSEPGSTDRIMEEICLSGNCAPNATTLVNPCL